MAKKYYKKVEKSCWESCEKWLNFYNFTEADNGNDNCSLCKIFYNEAICASTNLGVCPVHGRSGKTLCRNTPYRNYWAYATHDKNYYLKDPEAYERRQIMAKDEYRYLIEVTLEYANRRPRKRYPKIGPFSRG